MARKTNTNDIAVTYVAALDEMQSKLNALAKVMKAAKRNRQNFHAIHWGHVGDVRNVNGLLDQALRVRLTNEQ